MITEKHTLIFQNVAIPYTVKRSRRRRKGMAIGITQSGISVAVPMRTSAASIKQLVTKHAAWIIKKLAQLNANAQMAPPRHWKSGEEIYYLGKAYPLKVTPTLLPEPDCYLRQQQIEIFWPLAIIGEKCSQTMKHALIQWYKQKAAEVLTARANLYQAMLGVTYRQLTIANQKTQWGSCDRHGKLRLNWRLILLPRALLDYVVVHELCHIRHLNHSAAFWRLVESIFPDYMTRRKLLNKNTAVFLW